MKNEVVAVAISMVCLGAFAKGQVNIICSVQAEQCNLVQTVVSESTGIKVNLTHKASGEAMARLNAERANPKTDLWSGGTGDPHMQTAEMGLTMADKSASLSQLRDWAQQQAEQTGFKTVGIYSDPQGLGVAAKQFQLPSNKVAMLDERMPDFAKVRMVKYDCARYGSSAERKRLIGRWEKEVNSLPR